MDALGGRFAAAMGLNPRCAERMRLGHIVHHAFELCDTHIATRPAVVSAATQLLRLLHRPGALLEPPAKMSPCAPLAWRLQHARLLELKQADARIQVLAVVLVGVVGMAREADLDYMGTEFARRVLGRAHGGRVPTELAPVLVPPHRSARVVAYDGDTAWNNGDVAQDVHRMKDSARHARPVWSAYYQTAFFGLERQDLRHGGHLRWAEPDAVARGGAPPQAHDVCRATVDARASALGLLPHQYASLAPGARGCVDSAETAHAAYGAVHCRERFRPLDRDHPGFWAPRAGHLMTPMWHEHFPDDELVCLRTPARSGPGSSAAVLAPGGSRPACPGRTSPSAPPDLCSRTQLGRAARLATCCLRRQRAKTGSGGGKKRAKPAKASDHIGGHKRLRNSV